MKALKRQPAWSGRARSTISCIVLSIAVFLPVPSLAEREQELEQLYLAYEAYEQHIADGDIRGALPEARSAYELGQRLLGANNEDAANLGYNYGKNLLQVGEIDGALTILNETLEHFERIHGESSVELTPVLMALGHANANSSQRRLAKKLYSRAFSLSEQQFGEDSQQHGWFSVHAGLDMLRLGRDRSGDRIARSGYELMRASLGDEDARTGYAAYLLGEYELEVQNFAAAAAYLEAAMIAFNQSDDPSIPVILSTRRYLVQAYESMGERQRATPHVLALGAVTQFASPESYSPVFRKVPDYPYPAEFSRVEGFVTLEFSVDKNGYPFDPRVIGSEGHNDFPRAALDAVLLNRYAPRFVDGQPVVVHRVRLTYEFNLVELAKSRGLTNMSLYREPSRPASSYRPEDNPK